MSDENIVDFGQAKSRLDPERKEKAAKAVRKQFQSAMGWKNRVLSKPKAGSKGPKPNNGKKR